MFAFYPNPAAQAVTGNGFGLVPESRIVPGGEVLRYFGEDRIAAIALGRFQARGSANGSALDDWLESQKEVALEYPELVEYWIIDDNINGPPLSARFRFNLPAEAQCAANNLKNFNISVRLDDSVLTVDMAEPSGVQLVVKFTQRSGGNYIRQHCGLFLR
ncbi:DUF2934 domain-containing protein [Sorangium sp. So ce204]|uniref:DUF2934 domain-containing protein n=1 Tax=Sorangium sp. So ce204 TaxID=3133288 RepID=UPI003F6317AE